MVFSKNSMSENTVNTVFSKSHKNFHQEILSEFSNNSWKNRELSGNFEKCFLTNPCKSIYLKFFVKISANLENFCHSWSRHIQNCLLIGLARTVPRFKSRWSFHTALASLGCMKDLRLVNPGMAFTFGTRTAVLTYGPNEIRSVQKTRALIFSVWN